MKGIAYGLFFDSNVILVMWTLAQGRLLEKKWMKY